jgi:methyltransferase (TIGR00027 family)
MDDLILASIAEGCDCVLNLAAGFDTRPYRLALPSSLPWIEADLPALIEEKERLLSGETPACRLRRDKIDLSNAAARAAFFGRVLQGSSKTLVITEGLLGYLDDEVVRSLSQDLLSQNATRWWLLDVSSPVILQMMRRGMGAHLVNAPFKFAPPNGLAFFESLGWKSRDVRSVFREAVRYRRVPLLLRMFALFPEPDPRNVGRARWSAVVRFERGS